MNEPASITPARVARALFYGEIDYLQTFLKDDDSENCVFCERAIAEGPCHYIPAVNRWAGACCFDLARLHGITREQYGSRVGKPSHMGRVLSIPAGAVIPLAEMIAIRNERNAER